MRYIEKIIRIIRNCPVISGVTDYCFFMGILSTITSCIIVQQKRATNYVFQEVG